MLAMGTIVCQNCQKVVEMFDDEKITVLYCTCPTCQSKEQED